MMRHKENEQKRRDIIFVITNFFAAIPWQMLPIAPFLAPPITSLLDHDLLVPYFATMLHGMTQCHKLNVQLAVLKFTHQELFE